jgi:hypothetical protein
MLRTDVSKLRWMGMDMRPRGRRRVAVAATYAVFLLVAWMHPRGSGELMWVFYLTSIGQLMAVTVGAELSVWARRAIPGVAILAGVWALWVHPPRFDPVSTDVWAFAWVATYSVLGFGRLVEGAWRKGALTRRLLSRPRRLQTLDDFADHLFGERFAELTETQQMEVGQFQRESPMGAWVTRGSGRFPLVEDERVIHEDDRLRAQVQRVLTWVLVGSAVGWSMAIALGYPMRRETMVAWAWTLALLAMTLRQAIVLWTEESPDAAGGEIRPVEAGATMEA